MTAGDGSGRGVFSIRKRFGFEAAHHLPGLAPGHKCARPHGHSYSVEVTVSTEGDLVVLGFVGVPGFVAVPGFVVAPGGRGGFRRPVAVGPVPAGGVRSP